jgi:hypothetical protein
MTDMSSPHIVRTLSHRWDRQTCILWFTATFTDGHTVQVGLPLAHVVATFDACAQQVGLQLPPMVGDPEVESVDGLFSKIKRTVKKAGKLAQRATGLTDKRLGKLAKIAAKVARSKALSGVLAVSAFVPGLNVIGAAGLAAQQAAKLALTALENAKRAKMLLKSGIRTAKVMKAIAQGANVQRSVRQLAKDTSADARMAIAALKSLPAR